MLLHRQVLGGALGDRQVLGGAYWLLLVLVLNPTVVGSPRTRGSLLGSLVHYAYYPGLVGFSTVACRFQGGGPDHKQETGVRIFLDESYPGAGPNPTLARARILPWRGPERYAPQNPLEMRACVRTLSGKLFR